MTRFASLLPTLLVLLVGVAAPRAAAAQAHPLPPSARPLHQRLALADVVAAVAIESVETGRVHAVLEERLLGAPPERFEIKRSPTRPAPLSPGDHTLLLLRGARSPYVLVDEPHETIRLADDASAARWTAAVRAVLARRDDPRELVKLYRRWLDEGPETLRELGGKALGDPQAPFQPLSEATLLEFAEAALDRRAAPAARSSYGLLAMRSPAATTRLLEASLPGAAQLDETDLALATSALQGGRVHGSQALAPALIRAMAHDSRSLRQVAVRLAASLRDEAPPEVVAAVETVRSSDPEPALRVEAERALSVMPGRR